MKEGGRILAWLRFFRVVNLPTVPGDVFVGAAAMSVATDSFDPILVAWTALASVFIYMFGLADNDIVGAKTDLDRPIASGEISLRAARVARGICLFGALITGAAANLPPSWWIAALTLVGSIVVYNRTKSSIVMGLCRGFNVGCGAAVAWEAASKVWLDWRFALPFAAALVLTIYIAAVTKYSEGEAENPDKKRFVGVLIGDYVYLQLLVLTGLYLICPAAPTRLMLVFGAITLLVLRLFQMTFKKVSAS